jgi:hypothetical protein
MAQDNIIKALINLTSDSDEFWYKGIITEDNYDTNVKCLTTDKPTWSDFKTELDRLDALDVANQYQVDRLGEYPTLQDCIHALLDGGDTLTDLQAARQAVKDKYPKG